VSRKVALAIPSVRVVRHQTGPGRLGFKSQVGHFLPLSYSGSSSASSSLSFLICAMKITIISAPHVAARMKWNSAYKVLSEYLTS